VTAALVADRARAAREKFLEGLVDTAGDDGTADG